MAKKGKQYVYQLIWLGFVLFLLYQHSLVWMHIDDFGYASLNYAVNVGTVGNDYTVADVFKYLYLHYMEWGGRVLFYGIAIFIYHFCGLQGIRITQALIIFGIYYLAFHIITKEAKIERTATASIIVCSLYGVFQLALVREGVYWFSASIGYVWPILVLLLASYGLYSLILDENDLTAREPIRWALNGILWFVASFSQEEIAIAAVVSCAGLAVYGYFTCKTDIKCLSVPFVMALFGAIVMLAAPGNWQRLQISSDGGIIGRVQHNLPYLFRYIFMDGVKLFCLTISVTFLLSAIKCLEKAEKSRVLYNMYIVIQAVLVSILLLYPQIIHEGTKHAVVLLCMAVWTLIGYGILLYYLLQRQNVFAMICSISAVLSYGAMAAVPAIPIRITIPFILLMLPAMGTVLMEFAKNLMALISYLPVMLLLIVNLADISDGYRLNQPIQQANWATQSASAQEIQSGMDITEIILQKLYLDEYAGPLTYQEPHRWADALIRKYFALPDSTILVWEDPYEVSIWTDRKPDGAMNFNAQGACAVSITPSPYMGDEIIRINDMTVVPVRGKDYMSVQLLREENEDGRFTVQIESPTLNRSIDKVIKINE